MHGDFMKSTTAANMRRFHKDVKRILKKEEFTPLDSLLRRIAHK